MCESIGTGYDAPMGALGRWLEISGDGDRNALHEAVTEHIVEFLRTLVTPDLYEQLTPYLAEARYSDSWGPSASALHWTFTDGGGNCTRSKYLWTHWFAIAMSADWNAIGALVRAHGFQVTAERPRLRTRGDDGLVELRGDLWVIMDDALVTDGRGLPIDDLTDEEKALVEEARAACACGPCKRLAPELAVVSSPEEEEAARERAEQVLVAGARAGHERQQRREAERAAPSEDSMDEN